MAKHPVGARRFLGTETKIQLRAEELETLERSVMAAVEHNKLLTTKRPVEFIKRSTASASPLPGKFTRWQDRVSKKLVSYAILQSPLLNLCLLCRP
jgi:hypothetical protein